MKRQYLSIIAPIVFALSACGGGSSSSDSPSEPISSCSDPSTTTDPYLSTSYDSCEASDLDLTGLWMLVSDYSIIGTNTETNHQQRKIMIVTDNNDGTLNAHVCNSNEALRDFSFSSGSSGLSIYDSQAPADIDLSINSNVLMQGAHVSSGTTTVQSSSVTAIKIKDATSIGTLNLDYVLNGFSFSQDALDVSCFSQRKGTTAFISLPVSFDGESAIFFVNVSNNGTNEELSLSVFVPADPNDELEINLNFAVSGSEIEGENTGNTSANYIENTNGAVNLNSSVIDDNFPTNTATFELRIDL